MRRVVGSPGHVLDLKHDMMSLTSDESSLQVRCHVSIDGNDMCEDVAILEGGSHRTVGTPSHVECRKHDIR